MKLIDMISLIVGEDYPSTHRDNIVTMRRFVRNINNAIIFSDGTFPDNIETTWVSSILSDTGLPDRSMDRFMNQMVGLEPRTNADADNEMSLIAGMVRNGIEDVGDTAVWDINKLVYLMWKNGLAFMQSPQGDRFGIFGEVYVSMARFIGRLQCEINGRNVEPVPGDKKGVRAADYIAALLEMFTIPIDVGTVMEKIKLRQEESNSRYVLIDSGGIRNAYTECIFKSCMNSDENHQGKESLDYYDAMSNVKLLVGYKGDKAYSRAIMWGLRDGTYLVDRIYDYNKTMKMEEYIDKVVRSEEKTSNVLDSSGNTVEIKLKDARAGDGCAGMPGWKLRREKIYGVVCPLPNGIPNSNYSPYFDSVNGIYIPDKYGDKIVCLIGAQSLRIKAKIDKAATCNKFLRVSGSTASIRTCYYLVGSNGECVKDIDKIIRVNGVVVCKNDTISLCITPDRKVMVWDKPDMLNANKYNRLFESKKFVKEIIDRISITDIKKNPIQIDSIADNVKIYAHRDMVITNEFTGYTILKDEACLLINPPKKPNRYVNIGISGYNGVMVVEKDVVMGDVNAVELSEYHRATDDFYYNFPVYAHASEVVFDKHGNAYLADCIEINSDGLPVLKQKG